LFLQAINAALFFSFDQDSKEFLTYIRTHGVQQFIAAYKLAADASGDVLFWGDEVEYAILEKSGSDESRSVKLALVGSEMMEHLNELEKTQHNKGTNGGAWHQEYGSWMIEGTPSLPYAGYSRDLVEVN
jgi:glutamate--cysteine ligase catalytic subunit